MSAEDKQSRSDGGQEFDRLLKAANEVKDTNGVRPSSDTIRAYLLGTANKSQKDEVRGALLASSEFRLEMAALTEELERMETPLVQRELDASNNEAVPDLSAYVSGPHARTAATSSPWSRIRNLLSLTPAPRLAAALVIAVLAIASYLMLQTDELPIGTLSVKQQQVDPDVLIRLSPRDLSTQAENPTYETAELAALAGFRSALKYENGVFAIDSPLVASQTDAEAGDVLLRIREADGDARDFRTVLSSSLSDAKPEVSAWLLFLPQRRLCLVELASSKTEIQVGTSFGDKGLLIFVWRDKGLYHAGSVRSF
jgi:hypothetical protein